MGKKFGLVVWKRYDVDTNVKEYMGKPRISVEDLEPEEIRNPVIVENVGEN